MLCTRWLIGFFLGGCTVLAAADGGLAPRSDPRGGAAVQNARPSAKPADEPGAETDLAARLGSARQRAQQADWGATVEALRPVEAQLDAEALLLLSQALRKIGQTASAGATLRRGVERFPKREPLWLAWVDTALADGQWALALERVQGAATQLGPRPGLHLREAQAYFGLGKVLGAVQVRDVPNGRPGQFIPGWLLLEQRGPQRFLCCPRDSALYALRLALDAGLDEPAAHLLHARIWQKAGKPQLGFALLKSRESLLLEGGEPATLTTFAELALQADALDDYLRYRRLLSEREPHQRDAILAGAYRTVAERYAQRGEGALYREFSYRALRLRPDDVELAYQVAEAEWSAGHRAEAARLYRQVLEHEPAHPQRTRILERLAASGEPRPADGR